MLKAMNMSFCVSLVVVNYGVRRLLDVSERFSNF